MSRPRKTCRESALTTSAGTPPSPRARASRIARPVLPVAVAPAMRRSGGMVIARVRGWPARSVGVAGGAGHLASVVDDLTVAQLDDPVGEVDEHRVMGRDHDRHPL